jgi:hypothetical protein
MKMLLALPVFLINLSSAQEEITHDAFVNTTWEHLTENTQDLKSTLGQLDQLQLDAATLINEAISTKTSKEKLELCIGTFQKLKAQFIEAANDALSDTERVTISREISEFLPTPLHEVETILPSNSENTYIIQVLHSCSCLTPDTAREALPHFQALITVSTEYQQNLIKQIATQRAKLGQIARKTDFTQKQIANQIDAINLTLASIKTHVVSEE